MTAQTRMIPATAGATAATFGIFFMMQGLASHDDLTVRERTAPRFVDIFIENIKPPVVQKIDRITPPPPVEEEPVIEVPTVETGGNVLVIAGPPVRPDVIGSDSDLLRPGFSDGEMVPIVRVLPQYPRWALERGAEGWVVVSFTVGADGTVQDARVADAEPAGVFDRAALKAIQKFKYRPTVVDGQARPTRNVQFRMVFELPSAS